MHGTVSGPLKPLPVASTQNPEDNFKMLPEVARSNLPGRPLLQIKMQAVLLAETYRHDDVASLAAPGSIRTKQI
jgi:hypothetical protein